MAWKPGDRLQDGKYIVDKVLKEGGFGITYRVKDKTGQNFVVKTLNASTQASPEFFKFQQDFMNEALRLVQFKHPHIVRVYQLLQEIPLQGQERRILKFLPVRSEQPSIPLICMLMEYVQGIDLGEYVRKKGALSEAEALKYIRQIGEALSVIHQQGILHRDVKPGNIMLREGTSEAVLIDFGLAREFVPDQTQVHTQMFTPGFAPVEQYRLEAKRGSYTDVYGLASTLYYLVTGKAPTDVYDRVMDTPDCLVLPRQIVPNLSNRVEAAILRGMEVLPKHRPQSVQEWLDMLSPIPTPPKIIQPPIPEPHKEDSSLEIKPVSARYRYLETLLAEGKWREANEETANRMLEVAGRTKKDWLREEDIDQFPGEDLCTIDQLWVKYSDGHFGFSVQKRIYQSLGGTSEFNGEIWAAFGECVGWRKKREWLDYDNYVFNLSAQKGHLPKKQYVFPYKTIRALLSRQDLLPKVKLVSAKGADYRRLEALLAEGKWREADEETANRILEVAGRTEEGWLREQDIDNFPCVDLRTIDQLWVNYSNGHFGFSVQKRIYQSLGGTSKYDEKVWKIFGDRVGWRKDGKWLYCHELVFDISAQSGYLPACIAILNQL